MSKVHGLIPVVFWRREKGKQKGRDILVGEESFL